MGPQGRQEHLTISTLQFELCPGCYAALQAFLCGEEAVAAVGADQQDGRDGSAQAQRQNASKQAVV